MISEHAKQVGLGRRAFLQSLCGAATTFLTLNEAFAAVGNTGGVFQSAEGERIRARGGRGTLAGDEFIFDVQTHLVDPTGAWRNSGRANIGHRFSPTTLKADAARRIRSPAFPPTNTSSICSWTATLTLLCSRSCPNCPRTIRFRWKKQIVFEYSLIRWEVPTACSSTPWWIPNAGPEVAPLQLMKDAGWIATQSRPGSVTRNGVLTASASELDSPDVGIPFIERARELGVRNICIHKGIFFSEVFRKNLGAAPMSAVPRLDTPT